MRYRRIFLLFLSLAITTPMFSNESFESTLRQHLEAIESRDYESFEKTVTLENQLTFILPNGKITHTRGEFLNFIRSWFNEKTWKISYAIISKGSTSEMGYALLSMSYDDIDSNNNAHHLDHYLLLLFQKFKTGWHLIHDQNTKFPAKTG